MLRCIEHSRRQLSTLARVELSSSETPYLPCQLWLQKKSSTNGGGAAKVENVEIQCAISRLKSPLYKRLRLNGL